MTHTTRVLIALICAWAAQACDAEPLVNVGKTKSQPNVAGSSAGSTAGTAGGEAAGADGDDNEHDNHESDDEE
jgi:hypothetical protein